MHPVIDDALKVSTVINNLQLATCVDLYNNISYFRFDHIIPGQKYDRWWAISLPLATMHLPGQTIGNIDQDINYIMNKKDKSKKGKGKGKQGKGKTYNNNIRAHQISPSPTCLQRASPPSTSNNYLSSSNNLRYTIIKYDTRYALQHLHRLQPERLHQDLTFKTSVPSTTRTFVKESCSNHQASVDIDHRIHEHGVQYMNMGFTTSNDVVLTASGAS